MRECVSTYKRKDRVALKSENIVIVTECAIDQVEVVGGTTVRLGVFARI